MELNNIFEYVIRHSVQQSLSNSADKLDKQLIAKVLDLTIWLAKKDYTDSSTPFLLLEDIFDSQTIENCEQLLSIIELRVDELSNVSSFILFYSLFIYLSIQEVDFLHIG